MNDISNETINKLALIFKALAEGERNVELTRQVLCDNNDYDPYTIFKLIDMNNKNRINNEDIVSFLNKNKVYISKEEASFIIMFYDEDFDDEFSYLEFTNMIQSNNKITDFKYNNNSTNVLSYNVTLTFRKILEKELELVRRLTSMIKDIKSRYDFNLHNIYDILKSWTSICFDSINKFLSNAMIAHNNNDVRNIIKRLDFNRDGRVELKELHYFFGYKEMYLMNTNPNHNSITFSNTIEENKFNDYIKMIIETEEKIEGRKTDLALRHDFNIENVFRLFDKENKAYITPLNLKEGLYRLEIFVSDIEINILMNKYDTHRRGHLSYGDLFDMLTPFDKDLRCMVENRKPNSEPFMLSTKIYLVNLLKDIIDYELKINVLKSGYMSMRKRLKEIFALLDRNNHGYFDYNDWEEYLSRNKIGINNVKGRCLGFIRFDRKRRGAVEYCDVLDELSGI